MNVAWFSFAVFIIENTLCFDNDLLEKTFRGTKEFGFNLFYTKN